LKKILPKYTSLMCDENSLLVPIFGAFIITKNSKPDYYIVMQNIFFGMSNWYLYDIKGSITKRFTKFPIIPLDANFMLDRNSEPIFCK
jgi:1-phosphatidylinositol-4-phosphate 5-kinase/1-phosphatidylinositol-3-phosphate 5-kinase